MKKPDLNTQIAKYYVARKKGKTKTEAQLVAGYPKDGNHSARIEKSKRYQELERYYRDDLLQEISMQNIAKEHAKIINQDEELGAKLGAIKFAVERLEPEAQTKDDDDKVTVILKGKIDLNDGI
jgi:hypothetical protein